MVAAKYVQLPSTLKQKSWSWNASRMNPFEGRQAGCCHPILNNHCPSGLDHVSLYAFVVKTWKQYWNNLVIIYEPWILPLNPMTWSCPLDLLAWKVLELLFFFQEKKGWKVKVMKDLSAMHKGIYRDPGSGLFWSKRNDTFCCKTPPSKV